MTAAILNGKRLASQLQLQLAEEIKAMQKAGHPTPGLAVILVNDSAASATYVKNKRHACHLVNIKTFDFDLSTATTETQLLALIHRLNQDSQVNGILVQLPLPAHINTQLIIEAIDPTKDVDGFHPYNLGRLAQRQPLLRPCTPRGIMQLLTAYDIPIFGKHAVVIGASNIVGRPMGLELLMAGATITICHRGTTDLSTHVRQADLLIIATGTRGCIKTEWLNAKQVVVDVGMHRLENGKLTGDLDFEAAKSNVAWLTPVPGGVGPMTVTTLLQNTLTAAAYQRSYSLSNPSQ